MSMQRLTCATALALGLASTALHAAPVVTRMSDPGGPTAEDMVNVLLSQDAGITIVPGSVSYTGVPEAAGTFTGGGTNQANSIGIQTGIILSSGDAAFVSATPNQDGAAGIDNDAPGSPLLDGLNQGTTFNASILRELRTDPRHEHACRHQQRQLRRTQRRGGKRQQPVELSVLPRQSAEQRNDRYGNRRPDRRALLRRRCRSRRGEPHRARGRRRDRSHSRLGGIHRRRHFPVLRRSRPAAVRRPRAGAGPTGAGARQPGFAGPRVARPHVGTQTALNAPHRDEGGRSAALFLCASRGTAACRRYDPVSAVRAMRAASPTTCRVSTCANLPLRRFFSRITPRPLS